MTTNSESELFKADVALRFVECINRLDLDGLTDLMTDDHKLDVFGGHRLDGKEPNREGWAGYFSQFPEYMIHLWEVHVRDDLVVIVGTTTGSHLKQPRLVEFRDPLIWTARVRGDKVSEWNLLGLTDDNRKKLGIA